MKTKIITYQTEDGFLINGIRYVAGSKSSKCVIHIPGLAGNFYSSTYHREIAKYYNQVGFDYFSINTRGSEYQKQLKNSILGKSIMCGYTHENFEESRLDILGIIKYVVDKGFEEIVLQGHSSGCQKIIYTINSSKLNKAVKNVILLSPCDDIGLAIEHYGKEVFSEKIKYAENIEDENQLLPNDFFFGLPVTKKSFVSHFGKNNKFDIFSYYNEEGHFLSIKNNKLPTLVTFGEKDYVSNLDFVKNLYDRIDNYRLEIIKETGHKYNGKEKELSEILTNYVVG